MAEGTLDRDLKRRRALKALGVLGVMGGVGAAYFKEELSDIDQGGLLSRDVDLDFEERKSIREYMLSTIPSHRELEYLEDDSSIRNGLRFSLSDERAVVETAPIAKDSRSRSYRRKHMSDFLDYGQIEYFLASAQIADAAFYDGTLDERRLEENLDFIDELSTEHTSVYRGVYDPSDFGEGGSDGSENFYLGINDEENLFFEARYSPFSSNGGTPESRMQNSISAAERNIDNVKEELSDYEEFTEDLNVVIDVIGGRPWPETSYTRGSRWEDGEIDYTGISGLGSEGSAYLGSPVVYRPQKNDHIELIRSFGDWPEENVNLDREVTQGNLRNPDFTSSK